MSILLDAMDFQSDQFMTRRASKYRKERTTKWISKMNVMALYPPGFKSRLKGLLPHEEKGSAMLLRSIVQSIGSHSPKQQVKQKMAA